MQNNLKIKLKNKLIKIGFIIIYLIINNLALADCLISDNFANREEVKKFMYYMHTKHNFNLQQLEDLFKNYTCNQNVLNKISNPSEKLSWRKYKQLLISKDRIDKGKKFLIKYKDVLLKAEKKFMVPKEIIAAILGVESFYGERSGNIPVMESLATLSFDYPARKKFFTQELEQFLLLVKEEKLVPNQILGSYAGAMSPAQFISSSYRNYAVDFANIGSKDLNNMHNAIGSVANYLYQHGWAKNQPIAVVANMPVNHKNNKDYKNYAKYINQDLASPKPKHLLKQLQALGIKSKIFNQLSNDLLNKQVALIEFSNDNNNNDNEQSKEYWLGFNNFYVITRYNHSINYAMAIYQLAVNLGLKI